MKTREEIQARIEDFGRKMYFADKILYVKLLEKVELLRWVLEENKGTCRHMMKSDIPDSIHCALSDNAKMKSDCLGNCEKQTMCKYCEEGRDVTFDLDYSNSSFYLGLDDENHLTVAYEDEYSEYDRFKINYCPMCGRKLEGVEE